MARELAILVTARNMSGGVLRGVRSDIKGIQSEAKRAASNIGRNVGIGIAAAGVGIGVAVKAGIDSLVELEEANAQTAAAIKSTGGVAGLSLSDIRSLSEELERQTTIDDKLIQSGANVLLTFRKVNKDAFAPALELAMDLSTRLGTDLNSAVLQVGKALEDPVRGVTALRRAGVQLNDEQVAQIKTLVEQNDLYGAQQILLQELETQVGGSSRALAEGAGGAGRRFSDAVEDMQMALAQGFLPLIEKASEKIQTLVSDPQFMGRVESFGQTLADGFDRVLDIVDQIPWDSVATAMEITATATGAILDMFAGLPPWVQTAVITGWGLNKLSGGALGNIVGSLASGLIKGILNMNAGVVNINAATVNGGGGLPGVGGKAGGGFAGGLGRGLVTGGVVGGAAALTAGAVVSVVNFESMRNEQREGLQGILDEMPRSQASLDKIQSQIDKERPFLEGILFNTNIKPQLEAEAAEIRAAIDSSSATASSIATSWNSEQRAAYAALNAKQSDAVAAVRGQSGLLQQIRDKPLNVNLRTNVNVGVSLTEWQRRATSYTKTYSTNAPVFR